MNKIYLLSGPLKEGGFSSCVRDDLATNLKLLKRCVLISTRPYEYARNDEYKERMIRDLGEVGFSGDVILLDYRVSLDYAKKALKEADLIYFLGGDPVSQLKYILDNKFDEIVRNSNALMMGTSAGAMNLCKTVYYSKDEDYPRSFFYDGLGLVDLIIDPHFDIHNKEQVREINKNSLRKTIIGLPNDSAIMIMGHDIVYLGHVYRYVNGTLIKKKELLLHSPNLANTINKSIR